MTLEEFEAGTPLTPEECSEIQSAADALLEAIADIQLEHGEDATNAAFFAIADAWDEDARAAMN